MPKGIFLVGWDNTIGHVVEATIPAEITMDRDRMLHYLMAIQTLGTSPIIQVQDEKESALVFGLERRCTKSEGIFAKTRVIKRKAAGH